MHPPPATSAPSPGGLGCPTAGPRSCSSQTGWTLHQFRHSALTHLAENDVQLPLLMAKSRHRSLRTLQRYARPGPDAVAALTAAHDPGRRR
ncbi:MAG: tyrosine-type recombinase/integrase [Actinobacteria bacterium]|nr:tyrosine-type recombinase/integrase [Actinomycetota bacterium]MCA1699484.1 tyrosine-type recombinase/integrase [Actinomycetota bacterium]